MRDNVSRSILYNPYSWLVLKVRNARGFWNPNFIRNQYIRFETLPPLWQTILPPYAIVYFVTVVGLATLGIVLAPNNVPKLLIALYLLYSLCTFILTHFQGRLRVPLFPLFLPYAAFALLSWRNLLQFRSAKFYGALGVAALVLLLVFEQS